MAKQPTITTVSSGWLSSTQMNANFEALRDAFDNTLSLDGSTPNAMAADLDMGGNDILNAGTVNADSIVVDGADLSTSVAAAASSASAAASSASSAASSASSAASSASAAAAVADTLPDWQGAWVTATSYAVGDLVRESGAVYICLVAHTSGTFATDLSGAKWELFADKGAAGGGTGDMLAANNLSDVANAATARGNLVVPHRTGASTITGTWTFDVSPTFTGGLEINDSNNLRWGPAVGYSFAVASINSVGVGDDRTWLIDKTGQMFIASTCSYAPILLTNDTFSKVAGSFDPNGVVRLYHNSSQKLATSSTGITVTGAISADTAAGNWFLDEDDMASNSATKLASQQSIKAYVDANAGRVLLASKTASNSATLDFTEFNNASYRYYEVEFEAVVPATDGASLRCLMSTDGGSTYDSAASDYAFAVTGINSNTANSSAAAYIQLTAIGIGSATGEEGATGYFKLYHAGSASLKSRLLGQISYDSTSNAPASVHFNGRRNATEDTDAMRFYMSSGNIESGVIRLYGYN